MTASHDCDLIVVGSGASGLTAAVTAAILGLEVIVVEKEPQIGGTSAWSGGWMWVPRNPLARAAGIEEPLDEPLAYLRHEIGATFDEPMARVFLEQAPRMVRFLMQQAGFAFVDGNAIPDFHHPSPGSRGGGRSVCAAPFDGAKLGADLSRLKPPLDEVSPFGMGIGSGADMKHFLNATRRLDSFLHVAKRVLRHRLTQFSHGRGTHLVNGNALIARLMFAARQHGVTIVTDAPAEQLLHENGRISGVVTPKGTFHARRGIVLACGGFPHDTARKAELFPHAPNGHEHWSAAPLSNTGDGLRLAESVGGEIRRDVPHAGAWAPVSLVPTGHGLPGRFPHLIERAKPGLIMVRADGKRFTNEADSYHDVMKALFAASAADNSPAECWMICDHPFQRRYGLGRTRPRPFPTLSWRMNGYLKKASTLEALARQCGIAPNAFLETVAAHNADALEGRDMAFGKGDSPYNRVQGDPEHEPNPCLAPIAQGPFYAVKVVAGSLGTFAGLKADASARVLAQDGKPIEGLYTVGNDMASIMGGAYPAGGITLGPGMTFAYIAAHHVSGVPLINNALSATPEDAPHGL